MKEVTFITPSGRALKAMQPDFFPDTVEIKEEQFEETKNYIEKNDTYSMGCKKKAIIEDMAIYAWVGEDENGELGIKTGKSDIGIFAFISTDINKVDQEAIISMLKTQAAFTNKEITLVGFSKVKKIKKINTYNEVEEYAPDPVKTKVYHDRELHSQFIKMWDMAIGSPEYDKSVFNEFRDLIRERGIIL